MERRRDNVDHQLASHLQVPRGQLRHPVEDDGTERPTVGEESGPLLAQQDLGGLARVQELHVL